MVRLERRQRRRRRRRRRWWSSMRPCWWARSLHFEINLPPWRSERARMAPTSSLFVPCGTRGRSGSVWWRVGVGRRWPWYVVPTVAVLPKKEPGNEQSYKGPEKRSRGTLGRESAICHLIADLAAIDVKVADDESEGAARRDSQISRHPNPTSARTEEKDSTNSTTHTFFVLVCSRGFGWAARSRLFGGQQGLVGWHRPGGLSRGRE